MEAEGAGRFRAGIPSAGHAGRVAELSVEVGTPEYDAALDEAAGMIARAERVFLVGIGNSGSIAEYGARYLSNLGKFALA